MCYSKYENYNLDELLKIADQNLSDDDRDLALQIEKKTREDVENNLSSLEDEGYFLKWVDDWHLKELASHTALMIGEIVQAKGGKRKTDQAVNNFFNQMDLAIPDPETQEILADYFYSILRDKLDDIL